MKHDSTIGLSSTNLLAQIPVSDQPDVRITNVDEAVSLFRRLYGAINHAVPRRGPFSWQIWRAALGDITIHLGEINNAFDVSTSDANDRFAIVSAGAGQSVVSHRKNESVVLPGRSSCIVSPNRPFVVRSGLGFEPFTILIDNAVPMKHLESLTGKRPPGNLQFDPQMTLTDPNGRSVMQVMLALTYESYRPDASPLVIAALRDAFLTTLLMRTAHTHREALMLPVKTIGPGYLRRADEYIEAHLDEPLTMSHIAEEMGVSVRSLQLAFKMHRGQSPMQFIKGRRLDLARKRLLASTLGNTVASIATRAGFDHLGRFSVEYKKKFGESPSAALRRCVRRS